MPDLCAFPPPQSIKKAEVVKHAPVGGTGCPKQNYRAVLDEPEVLVTWRANNASLLGYHVG